MDVVCRVLGCPYHTASGFCKKRFLVINQNGTCRHLYLKNGQADPKWREPHEEMFERSPAPKEITEE